jgi:hypothetical protein
MTNHSPARTFQLAPMSPVVLIVTLVLLALPVIFIIAALAGTRLHIVPGLFVIAVYVWMWLRFRPNRFVVHEGSLEVIWPLKRREIPRDNISNVRLLDRDALRKEIGWGDAGGGRPACRPPALTA